MTRTDQGLPPVHPTTNPPTTPCVEIRSALASQQFNLDEHPGDPYAKGWNAAIAHADRVIAGLRELRNAKPLDLRLKSTLTGLGASVPGAPPPNGTDDPHATPPAAQGGGTYPFDLGGEA